MKRLFGTDGIRGNAGEFPLDSETVAKIGAAFADVFAQRLGRPARFVSGRDTRESGPEIEAAFHAGAALRGAEGESSGVKTTPGVAYLTGAFGFDAGIVISASHNPFYDNGIKIFLPTGEKIDESIEKLIETNVYASAGNGPARSAQLPTGRFSEFEGAYFFHLWSRSGGLDLDGLRIVVDSANGAASQIARVIFDRVGADLVSIFFNPNGRNINENCGSLHLEHLQAKVVEENAAFGVAFDGDADRALFVDENGEIVDGDATLWILANHLRNQGNLKSGKVVATVMSNIGLESALRATGIELIRTAVGDKYVLDELRRTGAEIGGEQSGHIILPQTSLVGDGILTAIFVLQALKTAGTSFSELRKGFTQFPQTLVNVLVTDKKPFDEVSAIAGAVQDVEQELGKEGRLLLRYSGTENLARVMIEGKDQAEIERLANSLADVIREQLG